MSSIKVEIWKTINFWEMKGRPATHYWDGRQWPGMPGGWNPTPGTNYRLEIVWGPKMRVTDVENWLEHAQLRIEFEGWKIGSGHSHRDSIQFYTDATYTQPTNPSWRIHLNYPKETVFQPFHADVVDYAYFRVTGNIGPAWKMRYNIGIYGSVFQGTWKAVNVL